MIILYNTSDNKLKWRLTGTLYNGHTTSYLSQKQETQKYTFHTLNYTQQHATELTEYEADTWSTCYSRQIG